MSKNLTLALAVWCTSCPGRCTYTFPLLITPDFFHRPAVQVHPVHSLATPVSEPINMPFKVSDVIASANLFNRLTCFSGTATPTLPLLIFIPTILLLQQFCTTVQSVNIHCVPKRWRQNSSNYNYGTSYQSCKYRLSSFNYHLSGANIANFNKIHCTVFE